VLRELPHGQQSYVNADRDPPTRSIARQREGDRDLGSAEIALHAATIMHTNVVTDVHVARAAGFDGIELWFPKLARYLDAGFSTAELLDELGPLRVTMLDALIPIESFDRDARRRLRAECSRMAEVAADLACPAIQVVALSEFESAEWSGQRSALIASLKELADISISHGVRLAVEPVVFSPFRSLSQALEVIDVVGPDRVGLCLDTWHLWTSGTRWDAVAAVDKALVIAAHLSDTQARSGTEWSDADRTALPGEGILPLRDAIDAIAATGYDGCWAVEMKSERHWEWEPATLATAILQRARSLLSDMGH
jgi:sugar phosphate isomerase/epimerase